MGDRIILCRDGVEHPLRVFPAFAEAEIACPKCERTPLRVQGSGMYPGEDDRHYAADGYCADCRAAVGTIRAYVDTLFGVREDVAVLHGRARVY